MYPQAEITIPYAVADYADLRLRGFYYVDKTRFIPELERYNAPVFLRPRRFRKSLLVSMLSYYYDINEAARFDALYGGTYIGSHPTAERNQYMVLRFNFSAMVMGNGPDALEQNLPSGRADLVLTGIPGSAFHNDCRVVEFKYFKAGEAEKIASLDAPAEADAQQVKHYATDINRQFPAYQMHAYVVYMAAGKACKVWQV